MYSKVIGLKGKAERLKMQVPVPPKATTFLICVRIDGCRNGKAYDTLPSKGMKIAEAGNVKMKGESLKHKVKAQRGKR
jgi:hypothetical protein